MGRATTSGDKKKRAVVNARPVTRASLSAQSAASETHVTSGEESRPPVTAMAPATTTAPMATSALMATTVPTATNAPTAIFGKHHTSDRANPKA